MLKLAPIAAALAFALPATAQTEAGAYPKTVPSAGGEVVIPSEAARDAYERIKFAPARRAGDYLYVSGVIAGPRSPNEGTDVEAFKGQVRRAFQSIQRTLAAEGLGFGDVVMINSFHVWSGPGFSGDREAQFAAFSAVKDEFMPPPHPAWTAVGTTGLLVERGVVEIQMIAYAPRKGR